MGYYAQHQLETLDSAASAFMHIKRLDMKAPDQSVRDYLGSFAFKGDRQNEPIAPFSGGCMVAICAKAEAVRTEVAARMMRMFISGE